MPSSLLLDSCFVVSLRFFSDAVHALGRRGFRYPTRRDDLAGSVVPAQPGASEAVPSAKLDRDFDRPEGQQEQGGTRRVDQHALQVFESTGVEEYRGALRRGRHQGVTAQGMGG